VAFWTSDTGIDGENRVEIDLCRHRDYAEVRALKGCDQGHQAVRVSA